MPATLYCDCVTVPCVHSELLVVLPATSYCDCVTVPGVASCYACGRSDDDYFVHLNECDGCSCWEVYCAGCTVLLQFAGDLILTILMGVIVLIVLLRGMKDIRDALTAPARLVR